MNKVLIIISFAITSFTLYSCKKSSTKPATTTSADQWTFMDSTYTEANGIVDTAARTLEETDRVGNLITITFNVFPKASGTYTVINGHAAPLSNISTGCTVWASQDYGSYSYMSTGKTGDIVNITLTGSTMKATFSNVTITQGQDTTTISGTLEQSY